MSANPSALGGLIDGWMQLPEYQQKMMVFFELAFQQTQITAADFVDMVPPQGLGVGGPMPALVQNVTRELRAHGARAGRRAVAIALSRSRSPHHGDRHAPPSRDAVIRGGPQAVVIVWCSHQLQVGLSVDT